MKNRIITVFTCIITCVILTACGAKNSGLYRISVGEENEAETDPESGENDMADGTDGQTGTTDDAEAEIEAEPDEPVAETATVYVHVCGAVRNPGVYELLTDDRIFTAIEAAGGFTEDASQDYVNLAEHLTDGMKITIPTEEELAAIETDIGTGTAAPVVIEYPEGSSGAQTETAGPGANNGSNELSAGLININTADEKLLTSITGIGETRARAIIAYREEHGPFTQTEDIKNVSGIGDSTYNKLKDEITVK